MQILRSKWSLLLPVATLLLTLIALAIPASIIYQRLRMAARGGAPAVSVHSKSFQVTIKRKNMLSFAISSAAALEEKTITGVHVPGMFDEVLISRFTTWPASWHPASIPLFSWRSYSLPFFCLPFGRSSALAQIASSRDSARIGPCCCSARSCPDCCSSSPSDLPFKSPAKRMLRSFCPSAVSTSGVSFWNLPGNLDRPAQVAEVLTGTPFTLAHSNVWTVHAKHEGTNAE